MELTEKNYKEDFCAKKISVIIPMYNAEKYIKKTLNSIIEQSYQNWEIIIIENGSEDKSPDIIREYEKKYPEIRMIKGPGKGPGPARNKGLKLAKGDYIVFVDADDYIEKNMYKIMIAQMESDSTLDVGVCLWNFIDQNGKKVVNKENISFLCFFSSSLDTCCASLNISGFMTIIINSSGSSSNSLKNGRKEIIHPINI